MSTRFMLLCGVLSLLSAPAWAWDLRVHGTVTEYLTGEAVTNATILVYKDGVKQYSVLSGSFGHYEFDLDNGAKYVLRFTAPGHQTKCFSVDTYGKCLQGEDGRKDVFVGMTLFEKIEGLDLSYFDLPMGMAHFEPWTGMLTWDQEYDGRIRAEVRAIMDEYERRMTATALATAPKREGTIVRR